MQGDPDPASGEIAMTQVYLRISGRGVEGAYSSYAAAQAESLDGERISTRVIRRVRTCSEWYCDHRPKKGHSICRCCQGLDCP